MSNILNSIELGGVEHLLQDQRVDENMIGYELDDSGTGLTFTKGIGVGIIVSDLDYSEEEQLTGKRWIDGKPIYQKTIPATLPRVNTEGIIADISDLDIDKLISSDGYCYTVDTSRGFPQYALNGIWGTIYTHSNNTELRAYTSGTVAQNSPCIVTIFYTKKSDTPSSPVKPVFPSSGDSKHVYSEEEKIVGTWIDGKPIYERTVKLQAKQMAESGGTLYDVPTIASVVDNFIGCKFIRIAGSQTGSIANSQSMEVAPVKENNTQIRVYSKLNVSYANIGVFQYTKTTD